MFIQSMEVPWYVRCSTHPHGTQVHGMLVHPAYFFCAFSTGYSGMCAVPSRWGVNLKNIKFPVSGKQPASTATLLTFSPRWTFPTIYSPIYTCNHLSSATQILHHTEKSTLNNKKSFKSGLKSQHHNMV